MFNDIINLLELEHLRNDIETIDSNTVNRELIVTIKLKRNLEGCTFCPSTNIKIKEYKKVNINHSLSHTRKITILYLKRRYFCKVCKKTFYEVDPFTDHHFRVSKLTIMNILEYLKDPNHTFSSCARLFNIHVDTVIAIFDKYVVPVRRKLPRVLCIDEVHIKANIKYPYSCVLLDFESNKIVDVLKTRHKKYLREYFDSFKYDELKQVEFVVMDMWSPYKDIVTEFMPHALIIADAFHVVVNIGRILDKKRISVMNSYLNLKVDDLNYTNDYGYLLKRYGWMLRTNPDKIKARDYYIKKYQMYVFKGDLLDHLLKADPELLEIYNLKNMYQKFNKRTTLEDSKEKLESLIELFINHNIPEIREYGRTLFRWKKEIINSFNKHNNIRYSNGKLESRNRQIKTIIRNAFGFKNFSRFRARVMYSINRDIPINLIK